MEGLASPFFQRALAAGMLAALASGVMGTYVVVKEASAVSGGMAHAAFGGLGLGYLLGFSPMAGAAGFALLSGLGVGLAHRRLHQGLDTLVMMMWSVGMAVGILCVAAVPGYAPDLTSYLFGNLLFVTPRYLWIAAALDVVVLAAVALFGRQLRAVAFDEEFSEIVGVPVDAVVLLLLGLASLVVVLLIRVVGVLLAVALLTIPAALARHWSDTLGRMMVVASLAGAAFIAVGLFGAYGLSTGLGVDLPSGPLIVLAAGAGFGVSAWLSGLRADAAGEGAA